MVISMETNMPILTLVRISVDIVMSDIKKLFSLKGMSFSVILLIVFLYQSESIAKLAIKTITVTRKAFFIKSSKVKLARAAIRMPTGLPNNVPAEQILEIGRAHV